MNIPAFAIHFFMYPVTITFTAKPSPKVSQKFFHNLKVVCNDGFIKRCWMMFCYCGAGRYNILVLLHNSGFCYTCTLKRCLLKMVDFRTNASQMLMVHDCSTLQTMIVTKGLFYFILSDQNKFVAIRQTSNKHTWQTVLNC